MPVCPRKACLVRVVKVVVGLSLPLAELLVNGDRLVRRTCHVKVRPDSFACGAAHTPVQDPVLVEFEDMVPDRE